MQKSDGITIGNKHFKTKREAENHIRSLLARYEPEAELVGQDLVFAQALLAKHPQRSEMDLQQSRTVEVELDPSGFKRFRAVREDNTKREFSWRKCVTPPSADQSLRSAMRTVVQEHIANFKRLWFFNRPGTCEHCKCEVTERTCHVDHAPPPTFEVLATSWLKSIGRKAEEIQITSSPKANEPSRFSDEGLATDWYEYHARNAELRILCPNCNLSETRKSTYTR